MATLTAEKINRLPSAATRNVDLMSSELAVYGYVTPELQAMVLDEELTHAAEILAVQETGYAAIPRTYYKKGEDFIDIHNQSLKQVFEDGIEYSCQEISESVAGADWELKRRQAEFNNLKTIINMSRGTVCVEISAPPTDKPEHEQLAQHYNDLTMIRASIKDESHKITQFNYAIPLSSPDFLLAVQRKLGIESASQKINSQELLENPILKEVNQPTGLAAREIGNLIGAALLEVAVGHSAVRMIKKAIENRREAWEFVTARDNADIHLELLAAMQQAAQLSPDVRIQAMNAIRSGFWKEFKDRFRGKQQATAEGGILMVAASRAVVDGDVFIACGSTVVATEFANSGNSTTSRAQIVESLRKEVRGNGSCSACGTKGSLYGCGLCQKCNKKWCDEYQRSGKQTDIKNLAYLNYARPSNELSGRGSETFMQYWERIGREITQKREIKKLREAEITRLKEKAKLAQSA